MLNTNIVDGFIGMLKKPIKPAVIRSGNMLGISEIKIMGGERNIQAIKIEMSTIANDRESTKLSIK